MSRVKQQPKMLHSLDLRSPLRMASSTLTCKKQAYSIVHNRMRLFLLLLSIVFVLVQPSVGWAAGNDVVDQSLHLDGTNMTLYWIIPFIGLLLSIAIMPLAVPLFWHHYYGTVAGFWVLTFIVPFTFSYGINVALYEVLHILFVDYIPFIILIGTLFILSGGVCVTGSIAGTPLANTGVLGLGTVLASFMSTTGAAMLLIRPLLRMNEQRYYRVHIKIFFIFLVANIGGSLTPLGDPPLFLGFLHGVDFFWPMRTMLMPMLFLSVSLLVIFYLLDSWHYRKEADHIHALHSKPDKGPTILLEGKRNLLLIGCVLLMILMQGIWQPDVRVDIYHFSIGLQNIVANLVLISLAALSLLITKPEIHVKNGFTWFPIREVSKLFIGIFLTIIPVIAMLKSGVNGSLGSIIALVSDNGQPIDMMYFWVTGILSSFLDNAPTYLIFFNTAGGDASILMDQRVLLAISAGAVFMGANSYIGNAPNFMVRSIAQESGVSMPSFFGYMVWSFVILMPLFLILSLIFFA